MHYEILDERRKKILPLLAIVSEGFYLAGGTALALRLGHRDSVDFDFFIPESFDTTDLRSHIEKTFLGHVVLVIQDELDTLTVVIDGEVKVSFFGYKYPLLMSLQETEHMRLASVIDIACMKLSAVVSRATQKDYVDLYYILKENTLKELLTACTTKYPTLDQNLILKSLIFFEDILEEPILFMPGFEVTKEVLENDLIEKVRAYQLG